MTTTQLRASKRAPLYRITRQRQKRSFIIMVHGKSKENETTHLWILSPILLAMIVASSIFLCAFAASAFEPLGVGVAPRCMSRFEFYAKAKVVFADDGTPYLKSRQTGIPVRFARIKDVHPAVKQALIIHGGAMENTDEIDKYLVNNLGLVVPKAWLNVIFVKSDGSRKMDKEY